MRVAALPSPSAHLPRCAGEGTDRCLGLTLEPSNSAQQKTPAIAGGGCRSYYRRDQPAEDDEAGAIGVASDEDAGAIGAADEEAGAIGVASDDDAAGAAEDDAGAIGVASDDEAAAEDEAGAADELTAAELDAVLTVVVLLPRLKIQIRPMITITATIMIIQVLRFMGFALR